MEPDWNSDTPDAPAAVIPISPSASRQALEIVPPRSRSFGSAALQLASGPMLVHLQAAVPHPAAPVSIYVDALPTPRHPLPPPDASQAAAPPQGLSRRVFARAIAYMEEHLGDNFSLDDLARAAGVSRFHFARLFRVTTGDSPMGYCLRLRIERAKHLLLAGDIRICEIAATLGFFDQSHFSRTFRRMTGVSPGEYARLAEVAQVPF